MFWLWCAMHRIMIWTPSLFRAMLLAHTSHLWNTSESWSLRIRKILNETKYNYSCRLHHMVTNQSDCLPQYHIQHSSYFTNCDCKTNCIQLFIAFIICVSVMHTKHKGADVTIPTTPEVSEANSKTIAQLTGSNVNTLAKSQWGCVSRWRLLEQIGSIQGK